MNKKGIAPIIIVLIIALLAAGGIGGYTYIKNKNKPIACMADAKLCPDGSSVGRIPPNCEFAECPTTTISITTTTTIVTTTTKAIAQQTCDSICKSKGYQRGTCICTLGDYQSAPPVNIGNTPDCQKEHEEYPKDKYNGTCCCYPAGRYSCISPEEQVAGGLVSHCTYDSNGKFTSLDECEKTCPGPSCTDSDEGNNIYIKGVVTLTGGNQTRTLTDACDGNNLVEIDCGGPYGFMENYEHCPSGYICQDGACIFSQ